MKLFSFSFFSYFSKTHIFRKENCPREEFLNLNQQRRNVERGKAMQQNWSAPSAKSVLLENIFDVSVIGNISLICTKTTWCNYIYLVHSVIVVSVSYKICERMDCTSLKNSFQDACSGKYLVQR